MNLIPCCDCAERILTESKVNTGLFINNEFIASKADATIEVFNPASNQKLATVSSAQAADVENAVAAATLALRKWKGTTPVQRGQLLGNLADLIERDADQLAYLEAIDAGILLGESRHLHISQSIETLRYFAGWADKLSGKSLDIPNGIAITKREPLGVCAAIVPWNAPL